MRASGGRLTGSAALLGKGGGAAARGVDLPRQHAPSAPLPRAARRRPPRPGQGARPRHQQGENQSDFHH